MIYKILANSVGFECVTDFEEMKLFRKKKWSYYELAMAGVGNRKVLLFPFYLAIFL